MEDEKKERTVGAKPYLPPFSSRFWWYKFIQIQNVIYHLKFELLETKIRLSTSLE